MGFLNNELHIMGATIKKALLLALYYSWTFVEKWQRTSDTKDREECIEADVPEQYTGPRAFRLLKENTNTWNWPWKQTGSWCN